MLVVNHGEKHSRALELPEIVSGLLVMLVVLWQACLGGDLSVASRYVEDEKAVLYLLTGLVWFNTLVVLVHVASHLFRRGQRVGRFLWLQSEGMESAAGLAHGALFLHQSAFVLER